VSSPPLPPLPDDLARLFARANEAAEPVALLDQVRGGVERAMILRGVPGFGPEDPGGGGPDGGGGGASGGGASGGGAASGGAASGGAAGASAAGATAGAITKAAAAKVAALAATVGIVIGVAAGREWGARTAVDVAARPAASLSAPPAPGSAASAASAGSAPLVAPTPLAPPSSDDSISVDALPTVAASAGAAARGPVGAPSSSSSSPSSGLAPEAAGRSALRQERELVDGAAGALKSGNAQQALTLGAQHERRFPAGQLAEEREVIVIEALIALGRRSEAGARTERFRKTFPSSPAGPRLAERISRGGP